MKLTAPQQETIAHSHRGTIQTLVLNGQDYLPHNLIPMEMATHQIALKTPHKPQAASPSIIYAITHHGATQSQHKKPKASLGFTAKM